MKAHYKFKSLFLVCFILVVALILRLPQLSGSFWLDEAAQALESARPFSQQLNIRDDFQPPLLHLITHVSIRFSTAEWWLRTWGALLPGLISVLFTYKLGKLLHSEKVGLLAALFIATSSLHIFYSQELRPYALPTAFAVTSSYVLLKWLSIESASILWYIVLTILGLFSSYVYPFFVLGQLSWIFAQPKKWKSLLSALTISGIGFLPWVPNFLEQLQAGTTVRSELPGWEQVVSIPQLKTVPLVFAKFLFGVLPVELTASYILFTFFVALLLLSLLWKHKLHSAKQTVILLTWIVVPLLTAWIISFWVPIIQPKRVLYLLPGFYLLLANQIAVGLYHIKTSLVAALLLALVLSLNLFSTVRYYTDPNLQRENWRSLHQQIVQQYPADRAIAVFSFPDPYAPWVWYDDGSFPTWSTGTLTTTAVPDLPNALKSISDKQYILVFDYLRDLTDPQNQILTTLQSLGYKERHTIDYPNIGFVRVYTRQETILSNSRL